MLTCPCNIHPLTPHVKSKTGVNKGIHYFLIFALKHRLWVLVSTTIYVLSNHMKKVKENQLKILMFTAVEYYTIIDFNEVDIRIYLPEKVIFTEAARPR